MGDGSRVRVKMTDRMVLMGLGIGLVYWVIECVLFIFMKEQTTFFGSLFGPGLGGLSTRIIVLCLFLIFGSHMQYTVAQRKKLESELDDLMAANECLRREVDALKKS